MTVTPTLATKAGMRATAVALSSMPLGSSMTGCGGGLAEAYRVRVVAVGMMLMRISRCAFSFVAESDERLSVRRRGTAAGTLALLCERQLRLSVRGGDRVKRYIC
jgi:hypothetical protein